MATHGQEDGCRYVTETCYVIPSLEFKTWRT